MGGAKPRSPRSLRPRRVLVTLEVETDITLSRLRAKVSWMHDDQLNGRVLEVEQVQTNVIQNRRNKPT